MNKMWCRHCAFVYSHDVGTLCGIVFLEVKRACSSLWYISQKGCGFDRVVGPHEMNNCSKKK